MAVQTFFKGRLRFIVTALVGMAAGSVITPASAQRSPAAGKNVVSLLSGRASEEGGGKKTCTLSKGVLTMSIEKRAPGFVMCCVQYAQPMRVRAGDEFSAEVELQRPEKEFHVKVESKAGPHIFLHNKQLGRGRFSNTLSFDENAEISKFCIAALGPGPLQDVFVHSATVQRK